VLSQHIQSTSEAIWVYYIVAALGCIYCCCWMQKKVCLADDKQNLCI